MRQTDHQRLQERLAREQARALKEIAACRQWWNELREFGVPHFEELGQRVERIRNQLAAYFEQEVQSGYFREIAESHPELALDLTALAEKHDRLICQFDALIARLEGAGPAFEYWGEAGECLDDCLKELAGQHREEDLLTRAQKSDGMTN